MSDPTKAVFLSYASQDAEAAKRICEALRAAGVEVWFDQSELVGGDQWDGKIRGQISSCALFVPIISANTQARLEGYFRREWKQAASRTHDMADEKTFLLPVVIDGTRDAEAKVPAEFKSVQWTKLQDGETPVTFCTRVQKLLGGEPGETASPRGGADEPRHKAASPIKNSPRWLAPVIAGGVIALLVLILARPWEKARPPVDPSPQRSAPPTTETSTAATSEARQLVARAWAQLNRPDMERPELQTADELCRRATGLDPTESSAWAAWSYVDSWYCYHALDDTPERREGARAKAARALQLAPASFDARLAQANYLVREGSDAALSLYAAEADQLLRTLLEERPAEPRALLAFAILQRNLGHAPEARLALETMAKDPAFAAQAWHESAWVELRLGSPTVALELEDRSIAIKPFSKNLTTKIYLLMDWRGDLDAAQAVLQQLPATAMQEDYTTSVALRLLHYRREPAALLRLANSIPRDWLQSNMFAGPLGWWKGLAEAQAGHEAAARLHLQAALQLVERRLAEAPSSYRLIAWKGRLLASLGEKAAAEKSLHLAWEMGGDKNHWDRWPDQMLIGETDQVVEELEKIRQNYPGAHWSARLRLNPEFDPLRRNARFLALLSQLDADPRSSPTAPAVPAASSLSPALAAPLPVDQKSVAVLAFANLSDDKANEYFSDGISEELLNVLAKVPGLKVTARTSSFHFKGKDTPIPEIAQQLGVAYVIEGSVRKQGDKVRITAQLIKAADGFHVWSDTFTRNLKDIFAVQDEIAGLIAQQLQLKLGDTAEIKKVVNPEAYRLVLEGRHYWLQRTDEAFARAQEAYAKALVIDPGFADAHAGIADVFVVRGWYHALSGASVTAADFARAREEATLALRLDPTLVAPHATLAAVNYNEGRFSEAELAFKDALRLNPNYAVALHWRSHLLMAQGRPDEALASIERSIELDPFSSITLVIYANWLEHTGRNADAVAVTERAMVLRNDQYIPLYGTRALALWNVGRRDEAVAAARVVTRDPKQEPRWWVDGSVVYVLRQAGLVDEARAHMTSMLAELSEGSTARAAVFAGMGEPDRAIAELARPERRLAGPGETYYTSVWAATRRDPRYRELIEKIGCAEFYQRAQETLARLQGARK